MKINPDGSHSLVSQNPDVVYTYIGCKYDPDADATDCDRLLECLEPQQREIFLRTAAAALDLKLVRSKIGRGVKGLLCHGEGSNGKDTLRAALAAVLGRGMTGKTLGDFKAYDGGRKFTLSGVEGSLCNWASENTSDVSLDKLQSLKQFITGDPLDVERKGKDAYEYKPQAIFLANCNKLPAITGGIAAIEGRYSILSFNKTYKRDADTSKGELEADPRLKDDENFIIEKIAPALLNKILERLPLLLAEGIDYRSTREAMQGAQEESRHLWQFANEVGIKAQAGGRIYMNDLLDTLNNWYQEQGILEAEYVSAGKDKYKEKYVWSDLPDKYDKPVKAITQLYARFKEIFPRIEKCRHTEGGSSDPRKGQRYLSGIALVKSDSDETSEVIASLVSLPFPESVPASLAVSLIASLPTPAASLADSGEEINLLIPDSGKATGETKSDAMKPSSDAASDAISDTETLTQRASDTSDAITSLDEEIEYSVGEQQIISLCETPESLAGAKQLIKELRAKSTPSVPEQSVASPEVTEQPTPPTTTPTQSKRVTIKKGQRVRYVGDNQNRIAQYGALDLVVDEISFDKYGLASVACFKPDGGYTTWLDPKDLSVIRSPLSD